MVEKKIKSIRIDLNQFKLYLFCKPKIELTLHFNSPSRRFYLSVIALVINEMKKKEKITSVLLQNHLDELILLNKTVGAEAGSSKKEHLLPRIYRKWKDVLPDLENAPLFKVIGRKKRYDELMDKVYVFSEGEKDCWGNLFEYMGSHENVRLRFSIDKLSTSLEDVAIVYGESPELLDADAWESFTRYLKQSQEDQLSSDSINSQALIPEPMPKPEDRRASIQSSRKWLIRFAMISLIVTLTAFMFWQGNIFSSKVEVASIEKMAFPLPEDPSIAILPFINLTGDPNQDYLGESVAAHLITILARVPELFVISQYTTFSYKGEKIKFKEIAEELGVRYIVLGNVQKSDDQVRITSQLIDVVSGQYLWAKTFDGHSNTFFKLQDDIAMEILRSLKEDIEYGRQSMYWLQWTSDIPEANKKKCEGLFLSRELTKDKNNRARRLFEEAIELDPGYIWAYVNLGFAHYWDFFFGYSQNPKKSLTLAYKNAQKSLEIDDRIDLGHSLMSLVYSRMGKLEKALYEAKKAVELNPNGAYSYAFLSGILSKLGRYEEAIINAKKGIRLDPKPTALYYFVLGQAYFMVNDYTNALEAFKTMTNVNPDNIYGYVFCAACYTCLGQPQKAKGKVEKILSLNPDFNLTSYGKIVQYKIKSDKDKYLDALRKAGIPEK